MRSVWGIGVLDDSYRKGFREALVCKGRVNLWYCISFFFYSFELDIKIILHNSSSEILHRESDSNITSQAYN